MAWAWGKDIDIDIAVAWVWHGSLAASDGVSAKTP